MPKPTGKLSAFERIELAIVCRWLAVRSVIQGEYSCWTLWDFKWRYSTRRDLVEVVIRVEDKEGVPSEEYVWCIEMDSLILRYDKEDLKSISQPESSGTTNLGP